FEVPVYRLVWLVLFRSQFYLRSFRLGYARGFAPSTPFEFLRPESEPVIEELSSLEDRYTLNRFNEVQHIAFRAAGMKAFEDPAVLLSGRLEAVIILGVLV